MKLVEAIAFSIGNKAKGINDDGQEIVVQERYAVGPEYRWFHVWHSYHRQIAEVDIVNLDELKSFKVDANGDYWTPVKS